MEEIEITKPDDWHVHFRDREILKVVVPETTRNFARAIVMPNLIPPILNGKQAIQYKKKFNEKELQRITFFQYLTLIYDHETALYVKDSFGYDSEVIHLNADSALTMFESDFFAKDDYYILKNGMSQLIDRMEEQIEKTSTILKTNCSVQEINEDYIVTSKGDKFYFEHLM